MLPEAASSADTEAAVATTAKTEAKAPTTEQAPAKKPAPEKVVAAEAVTEAETVTSEGTGGEKAPASPEEDPGFQAVIKRAKGVAAKQRSHPPATAKAQEAQAAAEAPASEVESKAQARQHSSKGLRNLLPRAWEMPKTSKRKTNWTG